MTTTLQHAYHTLTTDSGTDCVPHCAVVCREIKRQSTGKAIHMAQTVGSTESWPRLVISHKDSSGKLTGSMDASDVDSILLTVCSVPSASLLHPSYKPIVPQNLCD
jgi:hypothetical protein